MPRRFVSLAAGVCIAFVLATGALASPSTRGASGSTAAAPTREAVDALSTAWWQWALAIPVHSPPFTGPINHPLFDLTGAKCGVGQSGSVWFLGGAFFVYPPPAQQGPIVRKDCVVASGKSLFFPILNIEDSKLEEQSFGNPFGVSDLRRVVTTAMDGAANLSADVDGVSVPFARVDTAHKPSWSFTLPQDDLLSAIGEGPFSPGTYSPAVDDGYYVLLQPLSPGRHTIHFHGEIPAFNFSLDVTYKNLRVTA
jgi:hypothetical protein